jgi:tetratricopeptide (TPR) repeat protein
MSSTLIVRDAIALVMGDDAAPPELEGHLRARVEAVRSMPSKQVEEVLATIAADAGEDAASDVLSAALVLCLAHPRQAAGQKLNAAACGRRLAGAFEREENVDSAFAALRVVSAAAPGNAGIERAYASLMRRQGMVQELVDRYLARAQHLLDEGEQQEAIPWLREVLLLDRSRKDVARMIRDLRFDEVESKRARRRRVRVAGVALALSLAVSLGVLRERNVRRQFEVIPAAMHGDLPALQTRLGAIERFVGANPVWHGALGALQERSELRVEIERLQEEAAARLELEESARRRQDSMADSACIMARHAAERGDFAAALEEFRHALELASESWPHTERTRRDVEALEEHLAQAQPQGAQPDQEKP